MPREQPSSDETSSSASSTKNAKDKSNSTAMQALHGAADDNRRSCSEKDSGYSDTGSDSKHTNAKDRSNRKSRDTSDELPLNQNEPHKNCGNAVVAPPTGQLASFYIIKNMVLEQPHIVQKNGRLLWSNGANPNVSGSNPVLLLQPSNPPALQPRPPGKNNPTVKMENPAYLPILNSYPRIAPHPNKKPPDKTAPTAESDNQSKRVCTESNNTQVNGSPQVQCVHKICASNTVTSSDNAPVSSGQLTSSTELNKTSIINTRHRHVVNTVQVLKQSGLLDITLRTKELLRQSNATGRDVAQLRQHSDLLCQMASCSNQNPSNMEAWLTLHKNMAESGCYPDLKDVQALQVPTTQQNVSIIKTQSGEGDKDESLVDSSNLKEPTPKQMDVTREIKSETIVDNDTSLNSLDNE
ncbi:hypothetical protein NL108_004396 [Boleophthalmus pectinirostris]|uniref:CLOCK-interacting pacemaker-like n=1 Tax=Boleophthalmus pectinirostris TaxID=150288 RepID=UPI00242D8181|nr:CLOCK-interacting pacemaker-like [Boleophthalmus pectinirostris]XP_055004030.1 CLOCK-interacting pacemaker-like [Boleophthalmus pectinirostris]XP_055004031.1 CLOCK-interacting pacemaker-like [Boleophthalmus pectinirostris]XP_055004032.1 CLOCK-interacting pacemaker-like [Boleophthalmus pectinirostris]XP_055004033.1 CLOCK-interacting pacemaker-like [Boleophthalmus pectinirostris]KAJ0063580.1 hypothetical protein NL108_004396 [Boleophthalmus pectinirostris]